MYIVCFKLKKLMITVSILILTVFVFNITLADYIKTDETYEQLKELIWR